MKKQNFLFLGVIVLLTFFITASAFIFYHSNSQIQKGYLASEGSAAENFAVLTASNIHLTDAQVARLKEISYGELLQSDENKALETMMSNTSFSTKVDYAYVMMHLDPKEVKYMVTDQNADRYDAPVGTNLDIMWLLDVNVSDAAEDSVLNDTTSELSRYSYYIEEDKTIFSETPSYVYNSSEWGDHICGYAPLYSEEGNYIGAVGVELQVNDYATYCGNAVKALGTLMVVTLLTLTLLFLFIYRQYRKIHHEKVYTDALTGIGNRTYYNDRFIRYMNNQHGKRHTFALMIADVDFFKKVNDTFGHEIGDEVLIEMGLILRETFGKSQVVRFGGEEFVAGLWIESEEAVRGKIETLFEKVRTHKFSNLELDIHISLGCSYYDTDAVNGWVTSGLLRAADCVLYQCKENGRDQYKIEPYDPEKEYKK